MENPTMFMHDVRLPADMTPEEARKVLALHGHEIVIDAVLVMLREMSAESTRLTHLAARNSKLVHRGSQGEILVAEADDIRFHAGAAAALEDVFWEIHQAVSPAGEGRGEEQG